MARRETRSNPLTTIGGFFKSLFHTGKFDDGKLLAYLAALHDTNLIEGDPDSDDMRARSCSAGTPIPPNLR